MRAAERDELRAVSAAVLAVTAHLSMREVLQTIVESARRLLDAEYAALGVPDQAGSFAEFVVDGVSAEQWAAIGPLPRQHGLLGVMLRNPTPVRLPDIRAHPQFEWWPPAHPELRDFLGMPITDGGAILGAIYLANKRTPGGFTADDEDLASMLAAHAAIALVNARLYERVRELSIMEERTRIARELHDAVAQKLFSVRLTAAAAAAWLTSEPELAATELAAVRELAAEAAAELRAIVVGLRPVDLAGDGLELALRKQTDLLNRVHTAQVRFVGSPVPRLAAGREDAVYRIAQEALHNALRHATPSLVEIRLSALPGKRRAVLLEVCDDGAGFDVGSVDVGSVDVGSVDVGSVDVGSVADAGRRLGMASMRDRARGAGARLAVTSRPGGGTTVRLEVPVG